MLSSLVMIGWSILSKLIIGASPANNFDIAVFDDNGNKKTHGIMYYYNQLPKTINNILLADETIDEVIVACGNEQYAEGLKTRLQQSRENSEFYNSNNEIKYSVSITK